MSADKSLEDFSNGSSPVKQGFDKIHSDMEVFFGMSPDLLCIISSEARFLKLNPAWKDLLGYSEEEMLLHPFIEFLHPDDIEITTREFSEELEGKEGLNFVNRYRCRDGSYKWLEWKGKVTSDHDRVFAIARDITDRKILVEKLEESEWDFRSLFDNVSIGIYRTTPDGWILMANKAVVRMLGYSSFEELAARNLDSDWFEPTYSREQFRKQLEEEHEIVGLESRWVKRDGTSIYVRESVKAITDANGGILYYAGTMEDLTEKKNSEQRITDSEEKYRMLSENISDVIWVLNTSGYRFTYFSPSVFNLLGYTATEAVLKSVEDLILPQMVNPIKADILKGIHDFMNDNDFNNHHNHEIQQIRKDGSLVWVEITSSFRRNKAGEIEVLGVARNIEQRKNAENVLTHERMLLRMVIDHIPDAIYIKDKFGRKTLANLSDLKNMGYFNMKEVIGKTDLEIFDDEGARRGYDEDMEVLKSEYPLINHDGNFIDKLGTPRWFLTTKIPLFDDFGEISGLLGIGHDITERKEAELKLAQMAGELREINANKDKLFSIIAHDMRGPIGSFYQILEMLTSDRQLDDNIRKVLLEELKKASKNIFNLLENLLHWSKIQRSLINIDPENYVINNSINETLELLMPAYKQKSQTVIFNPEKEFTVYADQDSINLVLRNIISNAVKFTPNKGNIIIQLSQDKSTTSIFVSDTGVGMDKDVIENIFRAASFHTTFGTNGEKGSGLGLILCRDFIERNGGVIRTESEPGKGTIMVFTLPNFPQS